MELTRYAQSTISSHYKDLLDRLDLPELLRGLKPASAILNYKATKVLDEEMDRENSRERIRAADVVVKMGKLHLGEDRAPPVIKFHFQTVDKGILLNIGGQKDPHSNDDPDDPYIDGLLEDN